VSPEPRLDQVRAAVREALVGLLPAGWDIKRGIVTPTTLAQPTLYLEYTRIEPLPEAPIGHARCTFELTLTTELTDTAKGEDWADAAVVDLVLAIDAHDFISWSEATKAVILQNHLTWNLVVSILANTTPTPAPEPPADPEE
jgi:hypothetical protein